MLLSAMAEGYAGAASPTRCFHLPCHGTNDGKPTKLNFLSGGLAGTHGVEYTCGTLGNRHVCKVCKGSIIVSTIDFGKMGCLGVGCFPM